MRQSNVDTIMQILQIIMVIVPLQIYNKYFAYVLILILQSELHNCTIESTGFNDSLFYYLQNPTKNRQDK